MKKEKATIKLVLRTNKKLANGEHPIMLRVNWHRKRAEKSTGFSCKECNWSSSSECIKLVGKDLVPNAKKINAVIQNLKNDANEILNKFLYEGKDYSAQLIIDCLNGGNSISVVRDLNGLVDEYIAVNHLKIETILSIRGIQKHFLEYMEKDNVYLIDVKKVNASGFGRWCYEQGFKNNTIRTNIQKMKALFRYAEEIEAIPSNPFKFFNEGKVYKAETNKQALTKDIMLLFKQFYKRKVSNMGANVEKKFLVVGNEIFACNVFLLCYMFQGLALIDMAKLRLENVDSTRITDELNKYLVINTKRSKTHKPVPIAVRMDDLTILLITPYLKYMAEHNYLLPILSDNDDTEVKVLNKMRYATSAINKNLKKIWNEYNMWVKHITEEYGGVSLPSQGIYKGYFEHRLVHDIGIDKDNIEKFLISENTTLYSARHTFATIFINSEGAKTSELAQMMGRSVSGIDRYIKDLMGVEEVLRARDKMK